MYEATASALMTVPPVPIHRTNWFQSGILPPNAKRTAVNLSSAHRAIVAVATSSGKNISNVVKACRHYLEVLRIYMGEADDPSSLISRRTPFPPIFEWAFLAENCNPDSKQYPPEPLDVVVAPCALPAFEVVCTQLYVATTYLDNAISQQRMGEWEAAQRDFLNAADWLGYLTAQLSPSDDISGFSHEQMVRLVRQCLPIQVQVDWVRGTTEFAWISALFCQSNIMRGTASSNTEIGTIDDIRRSNDTHAVLAYLQEQYSEVRMLAMKDWLLSPHLANSQLPIARYTYDCCVRAHNIKRVRSLGIDCTLAGTAGTAGSGKTAAMVTLALANECLAIANNLPPTDRTTVSALLQDVRMQRECCQTAVANMTAVNMSAVNMSAVTGVEDNTAVVRDYRAGYYTDQMMSRLLPKHLRR